MGRELKIEEATLFRRNTVTPSAREYKRNQNALQQISVLEVLSVAGNLLYGPGIDDLF